MGRPCKCCESEDCTLSDLVNFKLLTDEGAIQRNKENIELRKSQGRFVDPFEEFTNAGGIGPPIPVGANELQWDILRGSANLSDLGAYSFNKNYTDLILSYTEEDFVALHKTPMSVSREINRIRLGLNFNVNYHQQKAAGIAVGGGIIMGAEVGLKHIMGDIMFFAKEDRGRNDSVQGWSFRIESTVATNLNYGQTGQERDINNDGVINEFDEMGKFAQGYDVDFILLDENGSPVMSKRMYYVDLPHVPSGSLNGSRLFADCDGFELDLNGPRGEADTNNDGTINESDETEGWNSLRTRSNISAVHIETRCDSDTVEFWLNQNAEFLLFTYDIPQHRRPGNRWGVRKTDFGDERPIISGGGGMIAGSDIGAGVFYPSTRGIVVGMGESAATDGEKAFSINAATWFNSSNLVECDSCYQTLFFENGFGGIPQTIMKIVIEDYPTEAYSFFSGGSNYQFLDWDSGLHSYTDSETFKNLGVSFTALGSRRSITDFTPGGNVNGTYYVGPDFAGCPDEDSEQRFCGLPNILLKLTGGSFTTFRMAGSQFSDPDINAKEEQLFQGVDNIIFKTNHDFYASSDIRQEQKTIDYQTASYNFFSQTVDIRDRTVAYDRNVVYVDNDNDIIIRSKGSPTNITIENPDRSGRRQGFRNIPFSNLANPRVIDGKLTYFKSSLRESLNLDGSVSLLPKENFAPLEIAKITVTMVNDYGD